MDEDKCKAIPLTLTLALPMSVFCYRLSFRRKRRPPAEASPPSLQSTYSEARRAVNVPERLDWVKFVNSSRPIPVGLVVS